MIEVKEDAIDYTKNYSKANPNKKIRVVAVKQLCIWHSEDD